ncbi:prohibitin family protein [Candidatus Micrarchaeota archaeon]|nr:prohibitin family protein [Candidatus Micrarchaeota archaeon]MBU1166482.1 prohibitin family protein [Candidatus Micrarchaeota archaeon]MBU1886188.1 prohibitin family protein [Candidatus Micrarchaeota archaeon]
MVIREKPEGEIRFESDNERLRINTPRREFPDVNKVFGTIFKTIIAFVILIVLFSSVKIIGAGEVGVLNEFGRPVTVLYEGLHFIVPIMHHVSVISIQIEKYEAEASAASKDLQIVTTTIAVNYRITPDEDVVMGIYRQFRGSHEARVIQPIVQEVIKANTAQFRAEELISKRVEVKNNILNDLKQKLSKYGMEVLDISITDFQFSPEFDRAIEDKVVAEQNKLRAEYELEQKKVEVQKTIAEANASAISEILKAQGDAQANIIRANAQAQAIESITKQITDPFIKYYYIETWNGELPLVMGTSDIMLDLSTIVDEEQEQTSNISTKAVVSRIGYN